MTVIDLLSIVDLEILSHVAISWNLPRNEELLVGISHLLTNVGHLYRIECCLRFYWLVLPPVLYIFPPN